METTSLPTVQQIEADLKAAGINPAGIYASLPKMIVEAIDTVRQFGLTYWEQQTCAGETVKRIVLNYA